MDEVKFSISLEGNLANEAGKGKASLDQLSSSLKKAKGELAAYQSQLALAKDLGDVEGYRKYSALVDQSKRSVFDLAQQVEHLGGAAGSSAEGLGAAGKGLGAVGGAAAAAAVAVGAVVAGVGHLIDIADGVTTFNGRLEASFEALGNMGPEGAKKYRAAIDDLAARLPQSREQIAEWTKQLQAAGVTDLGELRTQIRATAGAHALLGDQGAQAYEKLREKVQVAAESHTPLKIATKGLTTLYRAGLNITDVAARMGVSTNELASSLKAGTADAAKFGDAMTQSLLARGKRPLEEMGNDLGVVKLKAKEAFKHLFDDIDMGPLLEAGRGLISIIDQSQPSGRALKDGLGGGLNAVIKLIGSAMTEAQVFFLDVEILALESYIAMKPLIGAFEKVAGYAGKAKDFLLGPKPAAREFSLEAPTAKETSDDTTYRARRMAVLGPIATIGEGLSFIPDMIRGMADDQARAVAHESGVTLGKEVISGIREGTDTHSPSPLVIGIGRSVGMSLGMGLEAAPEPARAARTVSGNAIGGLVRGAAGAHGGLFGGGGGLRIERLDVHVTAPDGVTDATAITAFGLSVALERYQLAVGR